MKVYIFGKYGTKEKVLIIDSDNIDFNQQFSANVQEDLEKKYGGQWLLVDYLHPDKGEFLKFEDDFEYRGFHPKFKRYFTGADKF